MVPVFSKEAFEADGAQIILAESLDVLGWVELALLMVQVKVGET